MKRHWILGLLFALFLICGCNSSSDDPWPPDPTPDPPTNVDMTGDWEGNLTYQDGTTTRVRFIEIVQNGANVTGRIAFEQSSGDWADEDIRTGTVNNTSVTINARYGMADHPTDPNYYFDIDVQGTVSNNTFNGDYTSTAITPDNPSGEVVGTGKLELTKTAGGQTPGGGGGEQPPQGTISGNYDGTISYNGGGAQSVNLRDVVQNGATVTGTHELVKDDASVVTAPIENGSVNNGTISFRASYSSEDPNVNAVLFDYTGTLNADSAYAGDCVVTIQNADNTTQEGQGQFTFTQIRNILKSSQLVDGWEPEEEESSNELPYEIVENILLSIE